MSAICRWLAYYKLREYLFIFVPVIFKMLWKVFVIQFSTLSVNALKYTTTAPPTDKNQPNNKAKQTTQNPLGFPFPKKNAEGADDSAIYLAVIAFIRVLLSARSNMERHNSVLLRTAVSITPEVNLLVKDCSNFSIL